MACSWRFDQLLANLSGEKIHPEISSRKLCSWYSCTSCHHFDIRLSGHVDFSAVFMIPQRCSSVRSLEPSLVISTLVLSILLFSDVVISSFQPLSFRCSSACGVGSVVRLACCLYAIQHGSATRCQHIKFFSSRRIEIPCKMAQTLFVQLRLKNIGKLDHRSCQRPIFVHFSICQAVVYECTFIFT